MLALTRLTSVFSTHVEVIPRDGRPYRKTLVTPEGQKHLINKALKGKFDDNYQKVIVSTLGI